MLGWLVLLALAVWGLVRLLRYPAAPPGTRQLTRGEAAFVGAAADALFPPGGAVRPSGREAGIPDFLDRYLDALQPRQRVLIRALFFLVEQSTLFFPAGWNGLRRFSSLSPEAQGAALESWRTSRFAPRRLVFMSLRALLTMGYFNDPEVLRTLDLSPRAIDTPVVEADLLYPPAGRGPEAIRYGRDDLTGPSAGVPLGPASPIHPAFAEGASR